MKLGDPRWYVLEDDHTIRGTNDINEWGECREAKQRVAEDTIGRYWISTVFVGMDMGFRENELPIVFETMVFDNEDNSKRVVKGLGNDVYMERCATWDEAVKMHQRIVDAVKSGAIPESRTTDD